MRIALPSDSGAVGCYWCSREGGDHDARCPGRERHASHVPVPRDSQVACTAPGAFRCAPANRPRKFWCGGCLMESGDTR
jgi:hypothetical protein